MGRMILILMLVVLVACCMVGYTVADYSNCDDTAISKGYISSEARYSLLAGCQVEVNGRMIDVDDAPMYWDIQEP